MRNHIVTGESEGSAGTRRKQAGPLAPTPLGRVGKKAQPEAGTPRAAEVNRP